MKPWWLVVLVGCSQPSEPHESPSNREPASRRSIDLHVTGAALSIRGVELVPQAKAPGVLQLGYRVESRDSSVQVPALIMCRVAGYNVVYPASGEAKTPGRRLATLFRPDPFSEPVQACEVAFFVGDKQVATACYRDTTLVDGTCPAGTFAPPPHQTAYSVELARPSLELRHGTALVSGLFTVFEPLAPGRRFTTQLRCEDPVGSATGEGELAFLPLETLPAGASVYGPVAIFLDRTPAQTALCELRVVSRAVTGAPTEQVHARYCLTTGAVRAGDCSEK